MIYNLPGFQSVEHLSWLGLFKDLSEGTPKPSPFYHKRSLHKTRKECEHVREKFLQMRQVTSTLFLFFFFQVDGCKDQQNNRCLNCHLCSSLEVSEEVRQYLKTPTFDNWYDCKKCKKKKKKEAFVCFIYDIMTLLWPANHTWHAYRPATICTRPQDHSLKLDQGYKRLNWEMVQQFHVK